MWAVAREQGSRDKTLGPELPFHLLGYASGFGRRKAGVSKDAGAWATLAYH